jgi:phosphonate transport system substrate-binding protein
MPSQRLLRADEPARARAPSFDVCLCNLNEEPAMQRRRLIASASALAVLASASLPVMAQELREINFGIISTESTQNLRQDWGPILADMERKTGFKVNAFFAPDYAGIIEAMRFNKVQVAWYGNRAAIEAVDRAGGEVFAQMVNADGSQGYTSHLIVHKDSNLRTLDDVLKNAKSLSFGNGDPQSTSGFLVPGYYVFAVNKVDPRTAFKVSRGANHETNALAVANKQVDVATNNSENLEKMKARFPDKHDDLRIVWTSPLIPLDPLVMRTDLPASAKQRIRDFLLTYGGTEAEKAHLTKLSKLAGFRASDNRQLIPIRQLDLFREKLRLEGDEKLAAAERAQRIADIDRRLAELGQPVAQR